MLLNASPLNAGLLNASASAGEDAEGVFRPASVLLPVAWGTPTWMVKKAFEPQSVLSPLVVGTPTFVQGGTLRFNPESVSALLKVGVPGLHLIYQGGMSPGAQAFYPRSVTSPLTLGTPARAGYRAFSIPALAGLRLGTPRSVQVFRVSSLGESLLLGQVTLVQRLHVKSVVSRLLPTAPRLVRVFQAAPLPGLRLGQPQLAGIASFTLAPWVEGITVGAPDLRFVHRAYPTSRMARLGQPVFRRGHAC